MTNTGLLLGGDLLVARYDENGVLLGYSPLKPNVTSFEIKPSIKNITRKLTGKTNYGQTGDVVSLGEASELTLKFDNMGDAEAMAMALMGDDLPINVPAGNISTTNPKVLTLPTLDNLFELGHRKVSNVVLKSDDDSIVYLEGTDYTVDLELGMVTALSSGAIRAGDTVHASYDYAAMTGRKIETFTKQIIQCKLVLNGQNFANGRTIICTMEKVQFAPDGAMDLMSEKFSGASIKGNPITPAGKKSPFTLEYLN